MMNLQEYTKYWSQTEPLMRAKLEQLKTALEGKTAYSLTDIYQGGDEEFRLTLDLRQGVTTVLGIDFVLLDADVNGAEAGVGVKLDLVGYYGLMLGGYAPHNYTAEAFTTDVAEIVRRIEQLDVQELTTYILNEALVNPTLLKALESAD